MTYRALAGFLQLIPLFKHKAAFPALSRGDNDLVTGFVSPLPDMSQMFIDLLLADPDYAGYLSGRKGSTRGQVMCRICTMCIAGTVPDLISRVR